MRWMAFTLALLAAPALAQVRVDDAWTRATAPGAKVGAGYMKITSSAADRLLGGNRVRAGTTSGSWKTSALPRAAPTERWSSRHVR